jgi:hypothetical protein
MDGRPHPRAGRPAMKDILFALAACTVMYAAGKACYELITTGVTALINYFLGPPPSDGPK